MKNVNELIKLLSSKIESSYQEGITLDNAEKLAAEFLHAQIQISSLLKSSDLDARMKKSGLKAIKSAVYNETVSRTEKKPTESQLEHALNQHELVSQAQDDLDTSEVSRDELERYYDIFGNAHIYYRGIAKGKFE